MAEGRAPSAERMAVPKSRIPRLQRSVSIQDQLDRRRSSFSPPNLPRRSSIGGKAAATNDEELEALDSFSLSSIGSAVSCCVPTSSSAYMAAVQSSKERRVRPVKPLRFALHCHTPTTCNPSEYLTPTQRANLTIRRLKSMLTEAQSECQYKDFEIQRLTKELVELRLEHAQCAKKAPAPPDAVVNGPSPSLADSGHFDDLNLVNGRHSSKESLADKEAEAAHVSICSSVVQSDDESAWPIEKRRLMSFHIEQLNDLKRQHTDEVQTIRARLTDRLEQALEQLGESNTRYANLMSSYERNRDQLNTAEAELKTLRESVARQEQQMARLQSELDERETQEYEYREKNINEMDSFAKKITGQTLRIEQLESEVVRLQQDNERLNVTCQLRNDQVQTIEQLKSEVDRLNQEKLQLKSACEEASESALRIQQLQMEVDRLQLTGEQQNDHGFRVKHLEAEIDRLQQENEQTKLASEKEKTQALVIKNLEAEVDRLQQENNQLKVSAEQERASSLLSENLESESDRFQPENQQPASSIEELETDLIRCNRQLESEVDRLKKEIEQLELSQQRNDQILRVTELESEVRRLTEEILQSQPTRQAESEQILHIRHLESEVERLSQENQQLQCTWQQQNDQVLQASQLTAEVTRLRQENVRLQTSQQQDDQEWRIKQLEAEVDRLSRENQTLSSCQKQESAEGAESMAAVTEQLRAVTTELDKLKEINSKKEMDSSDAAVTLKFLRSAVFYLLTDHDNIGNHLRAVQNILDFSAEERAAVERLLRHGYFL